jgi:nuclear-control-of-ATPase protein 2
MPSPFVDHLLKPLDLSRPSSPISIQQPARQYEVFQHAPETTVKQTLRSLLVSLNRPFSDGLVNDTVGSLMQLERSSTATVDAEENTLKHAIISRLVVGLYSEGLDVCISQAVDAETEAEWWADIARSRRTVAWYLLQSIPIPTSHYNLANVFTTSAFPSRLVNLMRLILQTLRIQNLPVRLSAFSPASLRQLFPTLDSHRPNALTKALFPHINLQSFSVTSSVILFASSKPENGEATTFLDRVSSSLNSLFSLTNLPMELGRQECLFKRRELEKIRDNKAEALGRLAQMRGTLAVLVKEQPWNFQDFIHTLGCIVAGDTPAVFTPAAAPSNASKTLDHTLLEINRLSMAIFASQQASHQSLIDAQDLRRPSRLTLLWPRILLLPPLGIYVIRSVYTSRATLAEVASDAKETLEGFVTGWLIEPLREVLKTVRAGGEDGVIVRKEGVAADLEVGLNLMLII